MLEVLQQGNFANRESYGDPMDLQRIMQGSWDSNNVASYGAFSSLATATTGDKIYGSGGNAGLAASNRHMAYDPKSNTWPAMAAIPQQIQQHAMVPIGSKIYALGHGDNRNVYVYDIPTNKWETWTNVMPHGLEYPAVVARGNELFIFTNANARDRSLNPTTDYNYKFNVQTRVVTPLPSSLTLGVGCSSIAAAFLIQDNIYLVFGLSGPNYALQTNVKIFNPRNNTWTLLPKKATWPDARTTIGSSFMYGGRYIVVFGGRTGLLTATQTCFVLDTFTGSWSKMPNCPDFISLAGIGVVGNTAYVFSGRDFLAGLLRTASWKFTLRMNPVR